MYTPTNADLRFYRKHGYWVSPVVLDDGLLDEAAAGMEDIFAGRYDDPGPTRDGRRLVEWKPEDGDVLRKTGGASFRSRRVAPLARSPLLARVACIFSGTGGVRLWHDQVLYKPADADTVSGNVGWHTDRHNWRSSTSEEMLTVWIPLHDVDEACGGITFVDGSNRLDLESDDFDFYDRDLSRLDRSRSAELLKLPRVTPPLKKGQFTVHHSRTVHGSGPNRSGSPRRSVVIHYQPIDNRYREVRLADGTVYADPNDSLCRLLDGQPDYTDPELFPVLYVA